MKLPIRRKIILFVGVPTVAIFLALMAWVLGYSKHQAMRMHKNDMEDRAGMAAARFDDYISKAARGADITARFMTRVPGIDESQIYGLLSDNVRLSHRIYGAAIAFEPGAFKDGDALFAPYAFKGGDVAAGEDLVQTMNIDRSVYDWYGDEKWEWWHAAKRAGVGVWTEPYFDKGAGDILMTSYSAPFFEMGSDGETKRFRGVATVDIDLETLNAAIGSSIIRGLEFHVLDRDGHFVYSTLGPEMFDKSVYDLLADAADRGLVANVHTMLEGAGGEATLAGLFGSEKKMFAYSPIPSTGWMLVTAMAESDALTGYHQRASLVGGTFIAALALIVIGIFVVSGKLTRPVDLLRDKVLQIAGGESGVTLEDIRTGDEIEELAGAFAVMQEKVADREARLENARETTLTELLESAPDAMLVADSQGVICRINAHAAETFGYSREQMLGMSVKELMPERSRGGHGARLLGYFADPKPLDLGEALEMFGQCADGSEFPIEIGLSPFHEPEGMMAVVAIRDITVRREGQARLQEAREQAEAANLSKSEFLSHMSHELRTPLNGVLGYAQILQRSPDVTGKQRASLDAIISCGDHLLSLINDVLDLSKIEAGRMEVERAPSDLHQLVEGVANILRPRADENDVGFEIQVAPEVPAGVVTDAAKLRQILVNLLGNALKFTGGGEVVLRIGEVGDDTYRFEVIDNGIGIAADDLEGIFDPFKQVEAGKAAGGTGLGLAITRRLVEALGGALEVESAVGEGSNFHFTLPLEEVEGEGFAALGEDAFDASTARLAPGQEVSVLIADDRETNRDILEQMLGDMGFTTAVVDDGDVAVEALRERRFDMVLMDVRMPRMNGIDAVEAIRADAATEDVKVIAVTASVFPDFKKKALVAGFDDFLGKPFRTSELITKLKAHLGVEFIADELPTPAAEPAGEDARVACPERAMEDLRKALKIRNLTVINAIAERLQGDPATATAGAEIARLAGAFDFAGLAALAEGADLD